MRQFKVFLCLTIFLIFCSAVWGDIPKQINFQGVLRDSVGNPYPDGNYSITFRIYDAASGGNILWQEGQLIAISGGLFTHLLGSATPIPESVFNDSLRWLGVQVASNPEITPRSQLVSVAYSYRVGTVDRATGGTIFGSTAIQSDLSVSGNIELPVTTATTGMIKAGADRFIHNYGANNTFVGVNAGNLTMTGYSNTANGYYALFSNTTGYSNTANGYQALYFNTEGFWNTANGTWALFSNTTGNANTANGYAALYYNTGNYNSADGYYALFSNTTGNYNTANGYYALSNNTTGGANTANGWEALFSNTTGNGNTALGYSANVSSGSLSNATAIGYNAVVDASNKVRIGNTSVSSIGGQVDWSVFSDARMKTNVKESPLGLNFILELKPVSYTSLFPGHEDITYTGLIAQEVEKVLQELGVEFSGLDKPKSKESYYQLRYAEFVMPLIKAIQEQQNTIQDLQTQLGELQNLVQKLSEESQNGLTTTK